MTTDLPLSDDLDDDPPPDLRPPRSMRGRRSRRLWKELAPHCVVIGRFNAVTKPLLAALCLITAEVEADPEALTRDDLNRIKTLGRILGLTRDIDR